MADGSGYWRKQRGDGRSLREWREDEWVEDIYGSSLDAYDWRGREFQIENDEISGWEAAFMDGYDLAV